MPRKGGSRGNEMFGRKPRHPAVVEELCDLALKDLESPKDLPIPALPELFSRRDAALRFLARTKDSDVERLLETVYTDLDIDLGEWLGNLPGILAAAKLVDEALDLLRKLEASFPGSDLGAETALILADAGRRDEALAQVEKCLAGTSNPWTIARAADALKALDEKGRAQILYRKAQALSDDPGERSRFIEREIPLLEELGRVDEAKALREALEELKDTEPYEDEDPGEEEALPQPATATPEPARNAPCPCGSGKKYKRCCGKAE